MTPDAPQAVEQLLRRRLSSCSSSSATATSPPTPQADEEQLRRNLSLCSTTSSIATSATSAFLDKEKFADCYDGIVPMFRGSKKKLYKAEDKLVVRGPIMKLLDPLFLAPFKSPLFRRHAKQHEPSALKQNADLCFKEFKEKIKETIRLLCANSKSKEPFLEQRYFWCAYDLVRKRRANQIQKWRLHGRPCNFCYGGKDLYEATYGKIKANPIQQSRKRTRITKKKIMFSELPPEIRSQYNEISRELEIRRDIADLSRDLDAEEAAEVAAAAASHPAPESRSSPPPPEINRHSETWCSDSTMDYGDSAAEVDPFFETNKDDELQCSPRECERCHSKFDWNNSDGDQQKFCRRCAEECKCEVCGKKLTALTAFPKGNMDWSGGEEKQSWCSDCYGKIVRDKMLPEVNSRIEEDEQRKRKRDGKSTPSKKQQTPCKKCGARTHKTSRSRLCPHNPKYLCFQENTGESVDVGKENAGESVNVAKTKDNEKMKCKRCGATTHKTARSRLCPHNKKNIQNQETKDNPPQKKARLQNQKRFGGKSPHNIAKATANKTSATPMAIITEPVVAGDNPRPTTPPAPAAPSPQLAYNLGDNVLAMFGPRQYALAHVIARTGVKHDVYFVDDAIVKKGLSPEQLRPCPPSYAAPKRRDMLGKVFEYEGDEDIPAGTKWKVRQVVGGTMYRCVKVTGGGELNVDNFDIGFVMRALRKEYENRRELGPRFS